MNKPLLLACATIALTACIKDYSHVTSTHRVMANPTEAELGKDVIRARLLDPASAVFENIQVIETTNAETGRVTQTTCGVVRSRNGFGGMAPAKQFLANTQVMGRISPSQDKASEYIKWAQLFNSYCTDGGLNAK